jgi:radical SAM superfamily enzyme YgiQ (UPF0313 family)
MKVLLIEPPFHRFMGLYRHYYPLGLAYIAAALESRNHVVEIYDAEHDPRAKFRSFLETSHDYTQYLDAIDDQEHPVWSEIRQEISRFEPELVGISVLSVKVPSALRIASLCNTGGKRIPVVVGGEHPTARSPDLLMNESVDFAVRGEGEETMCELVEALEHDLPLEGIDGLSFKNGGRIQQNRNRKLIENLNRLPIPARNALAQRESYRPIDFGLIMGSRGCTYRCAFCPTPNIWGRRVRFRSVEAVVSEMQLVKETYSTSYFSFRDYSFSVNPKWTMQFCEMVKKEQLDIGWECTTRPDLVDEGIVDFMKQAGCVTIRVGIESGSQKLLDQIKKDLSLRRVREMAKILNRQNLYWTAYFMFDLPSETRDDIEATFNLIDEIDPPFVTMARYTPMPGSEMYEDLAREGKTPGTNPNWGRWSNQWLEPQVTGESTQEACHEKMEEIAQRIDEHNRRHDLGARHPLLKLS